MHCKGYLDHNKEQKLKILFSKFGTAGLEPSNAHIQGWQYLLAQLRNQISDTVCILGKKNLGWYIHMIVVFSDP